MAKLKSSRVWIIVAIVVAIAGFFGFRFWKQNYVRAYLRSPGNKVVFAGDAATAERKGFGPGCNALVWGQRETADVRELAAKHGVTLWRMEDGFLRSVGLGSDFNLPASLVLDRSGIYFDPQAPSDLETCNTATVGRPAVAGSDAKTISEIIDAARPLHTAPNA